MIFIQPEPAPAVLTQLFASHVNGDVLRENFVGRDTNKLGKHRAGFSLLGHDLAILIDYGVGAVGAPVALGGILIAIIVFTPESVTAIGAATGNEMQRSLNLCLGAFVSTVGLTVPVVLIIGAFLGMQMRSYRRFFIQPDSGSLSISLQQFEKPDLDRTDAHRSIESPKGTSFLRSMLLVVMLLPIVLPQPTC